MNLEQFTRMVAEFVSKQSGASVERIDANLNYVQAGLLDSLGVIKLLFFIQDRFGTRFKSADLSTENLSTPAALFAVVMRHQASAADGAADPSRLPLELRLDEVLSWRAQHSGDDAALVYEREPCTGTVLTWRELDRQADRCAATLEAQHITRASRVALVLEDSPACLAALLGIWRVGGVVVPIDERWGAATTRAIVSHAEPVCIIGRGDIGIERTVGTTGCVPFLPFERLRQNGSEPTRKAACSADDTAMIAYTSGTTSNPKGVVLRHTHLRHAYRIARDSLFDTLPSRFGQVFRTGGLGALGANYLMPLDCGVPVVILPELGPMTAERFWHDVKRTGVDFIYLVPTLVQLVTRLSEPVADPRPILCITGGAPIPEEVHRAFQDLFQHRLRNVYGLTEASFGFLWGADESPHRAASHLGRPPRGIEIRLRDAAGNCGPSVTDGMLEVSGPVLSDGYWKNESATREVFVDGWLRTGDLAHRDAGGNYSITGRAKEVAIRGGFTIHLDEVDDVLLTHPHVLSACAVGIAGDREEELAAAVHLRAGVSTTTEELAKWCRDRVGPLKTPGTIVVTADELPRNSSGKIVRARVAQMLSIDRA